MIAPVKVAASLEKVTTMKDRSIRLTFDTQELPHSKCADLLSMRNALGWLIFCPTATEEVELPTEQIEFKGDKTSSERLRAVLFIEWKQMGEKRNFNDYYKSRMEHFIDLVKESLEP